MTQWYVKDLSRLTGVSVQTLHHYDRIDLLKPSVRLANGYRVYSERDLLQLQQIIALKFFGFNLAQIKVLLTDHDGALEHFSTQVQFLEQKAKIWLDASQALKNITSDVKDYKSIPWKNIIQLIEVYRMTQELEKTWVGKVLTPEEITQYATFQSGLEVRFTPQDKENFTQQWCGLIDQARTHLDMDPRSEFGVTLAQQIMDLVNGMYGQDNVNLRNSIWHKGFKRGKMDDHRALDPKIVAWLDQAIDHYYRKRIYTLLDQVELGATPELLKRWTDLMNEMFGDSEELKQAAYEAGRQKDDRRISPNAKEWLKQFLKP